MKIIQDHRIGIGDIAWHGPRECSVALRLESSVIFEDEHGISLNVGAHAIPVNRQVFHAEEENYRTVVPAHIGRGSFIGFSNIVQLIGYCAGAVGTAVQCTCVLHNGELKLAVLRFRLHFRRQRRCVLMRSGTVPVEDDP